MAGPSWTSISRRLVTAASASVLLLAGCAGGSGGSDAPAEAEGPVALTLSVFGAADSWRALVEEYEQANPDVTVELNIAASEADARTNMFTKLAAGSGLADVEQTEIAWTGELAQFADQFVAVASDDGGDWVGFQSEAATAEDGTLFAYGVGTGPVAICYRADLLEQAGMASDPESVAAMVGGSWEDYFAAGEQYVDGGGQGGWFDSASTIYEARIEQLATPYETEDGEIVAGSGEVEEIFRDTLAVAPRLSAKLAPFSEDWSAAMASGAFATMACPSWMLTIIEGNAPDLTDWRIANAFPGGGGNLGGSFLVVPQQSEQPEQAAELASWLTAPEQQIAAFQSGSAFPSRLEALESPDLLDITNPYFDDAPVGQIFADRSTAITTTVYKGPQFSPIAVAAFDATQRVENGQQPVDEAWEQFVSEVEDLQ